VSDAVDEELERIEQLALAAPFPSVLDAQEFTPNATG
jgi:hypothetical protein